MKWILGKLHRDVVVDDVFLSLIKKSRIQETRFAITHEFNSKRVITGQESPHGHETFLCICETIGARREYLFLFAVPVFVRARRYHDGGILPALAGRPVANIIQYDFTGYEHDDGIHKFPCRLGRRGNTSLRSLGRQL